MVALVSVPPEHVPEGILGLIGSHRPFIEHVRVVIAEPASNDTGTTSETMASSSSSLRASATESTASLVGAEQQQQQQQSSMSSSGMDVDVEGPDPHKKSGRTYLILFQMASEGDAITFIEDLDGRPYIAFDDQDICSVEHVVGLQGQDGVSLLNPNFAPSMTKNATGRALEILPSPSPASIAGVIQPMAGGSEDCKTEGGGIDLNKPSSSSSSSSPRNKGTHFMDDQNCAVCLEHLALHPEEHTAGKTSILTTVCNHTFHLDCLGKWSGPCIVCRFDHSGLNETLSQCHLCGTTEHNYVCLICGVISCVGMVASAEGPLSSHVAAAAAASSQHPLNTPSGAAATAHRFYTSHAGQHYNETLHAYALDTSTQHGKCVIKDGNSII
jgi:BRCA1-associated protein